MKIVADEGVDALIVKRLREDSHEVIYVAEIASAITDEAVLKLAIDENAILLTADKDFGELVIRQQRKHKGVVLLRLAGIIPRDKADKVAFVFRHHRDDLSNAFSVISPNKLRVRKY